jgi:tetratricopeptide (TPR) repeat protein
VAQRLRELTPARSAAHTLGAELRRLRVEHGLSQTALGELIHHSGALVGKVEKAERFPTAEFCELVDAALRTGGRLARMRPAADPRHDSGPLCFVDPSWTVGASLRALKDLTGEPVDRREFLALTGSALAGIVVNWATAIDAVDALPAAGRRRLGQATLNRLSRRLADLRALDDELGGTVLRDLAVAELRWLIRLADNPTLPGGEQRQLFGLIAEAARLCGWLHLDADRGGPAQAFYVTALRCSADAADPLTGAHILAGMGFQAMLAGRTADALSLLGSAQDRAGRLASPRLEALLASRQARAHARAGDQRACGRALNRAETALEKARDSNAEPDWIYYFDEAELAAQAGACWADLRQPDRARPLLDEALDNLASQYVRDRTIYHARSAQTHLHSGNLDLACHDLTAAAELVRQTGSVRSIATIREARRAMSAYAREPIVREFDQTLARALGTAA